MSKCIVRLESDPSDKQAEERIRVLLVEAEEWKGLLEWFGKLQAEALEASRQALEDQTGAITTRN